MKSPVTIRTGPTIEANLAFIRDAYAQLRGDVREIIPTVSYGSSFTDLGAITHNTSTQTVKATFTNFVNTQYNEDSLLVWLCGKVLVTEAGGSSTGTWRLRHGGLTGNIITSVALTVANGAGSKDQYAAVHAVYKPQARGLQTLVYTLTYVGTGGNISVQEDNLIVWRVGPEAVSFIKGLAT